MPFQESIKESSIFKTFSLFKKELINLKVNKEDISFIMKNISIKSHISEEEIKQSALNISKIFPICKKENLEFPIFTNSKIEDFSNENLRKNNITIDTFHLTPTFYVGIALKEALLENEIQEAMAIQILGNLNINVSDRVLENKEEFDQFIKDKAKHLANLVRESQKEGITDYLLNKKTPFKISYH